MIVENLLECKRGRKNRRKLGRVQEGLLESERFWGELERGN